MRRKSAKKLLYVLAVMLAATLIGCGSKEECPYEEFIVVDVFDNQANYQGIQSGWFAKIVKEKFNMELNIIAPNVSGGGDTLYEMRSAAGNLGDLILCGASQGELQDLVDAGLLYNMESSLQGKEILKYSYAINHLNDTIEQNGIYAIPSEVSVQSPLEPSEGTETVYGPYIRWDLYAKLGYPKMETIEDLLPVLAKMQELEPVSETGEKTYAFSFFSDWDNNMMNFLKQPCCLYGYDEYGFVLSKADGSDYQDILQEDSLYLRICHMMFEANQMGLIDPASRTQNYDACFSKYQDGAVLFSPWPWLGQSAYNTAERTAQGKGFMFAPIDDLLVYSHGCNPEGNLQNVIAIGSQAEDPERLVDFINWLYSAEGISVNGAQLSGSTAGPEGLTWEMREDGPYLTELGQKALFQSDVEVPEEWGGGIWEFGTSALNFKPVAQCEKDENGYYYCFDLWDSVRELANTALTEDWQEVMQAETTIEYLQKHNQIIVATGCGYIAPEESTELSSIRNQCSRVIKENSWNMVFAEDEEEYQALLQDMRDKVDSYGYDKILAYDMENAKGQSEARKQAVANYESLTRIQQASGN